MELGWCREKHAKPAYFEQFHPNYCRFLLTGFEY